MTNPDDKQESNRKKTDKSASDKLKSILSSRKKDEQIIQDVSSSLYEQEKTVENQPESSISRISKQLNTESNEQKAEIYLRSEDGKDIKKSSTDNRVVSNRKDNGMEMSVLSRFKDLFSKGNGKEPPKLPPKDNFLKFFKKDPKGCLVYGALGTLLIVIITGIIVVSFTECG